MRDILETIETGFAALAGNQYPAKLFPQTIPLLSRFFMSLTKPNRFRLHFDPDSPSPVIVRFSHRFADRWQAYFRKSCSHFHTIHEIVRNPPGYLDVCKRLRNGGGSRATARFTLRSDETLEMPGPPSFRASKRRGLPWDKSDGEELQLHPEHPRNEPLKSSASARSKPDWKPGDTAAKDGCRYNRSARSRLFERPRQKIGSTIASTGRLFAPSCFVIDLFKL